MSLFVAGSEARSCKEIRPLYCKYTDENCVYKEHSVGLRPRSHQTLSWHRKSSTFSVVRDWKKIGMMKQAVQFRELLPCSSQRQ